MRCAGWYLSSLDRPRAEPFKKIMADIGGWAVDPVTPSAFATLFLREFDDPKLTRLDEEFRKFVAELAAPWDEVRSGAGLRGDRWIQVAFADTNAVAFMTSRRDGALLHPRRVGFCPRNASQMNLMRGARPKDGFRRY